MPETKSFEIIEHTADTGIRAYGRSREQLLENAARGLFSIITDLGLVEEREVRRVEVSAPDDEALAVEWLSELLFLHETESMLFAGFKVTEKGENEIEGELRGEPYDPGRHLLLAEVKAVTYHMLEVSRRGDAWEATIVFDV